MSRNHLQRFQYSHSAAIGGGRFPRWAHFPVHSVSCATTSGRRIPEGYDDLTIGSLRGKIAVKDVSDTSCIDRFNSVSRHAQSTHVQVAMVAALVTVASTRRSPVSTH